MTEAIIEATGIGKRYQLGSVRGFGSLQETFRQTINGILRTNSNDQSNESQPDFWALKDVNFQIKQGEVVGIIGRNGAGKSTLLKVLSRITEPTEGRITLRGRVASLLEVGVGFHPELSGTENIYLNGAILGMRKQEIRRKFDEIVAFAEIEKFINTPVKRYSSGMYVRLAFAVAAHLEPEILLVDEVLAVGDLSFQKKCIGKMGEVAKDGRTVVFVSHNMAAVKQLCRRGIVMSQGKVSADADVGEAVDIYLHDASKTDEGSRTWDVSSAGHSAYPIKLEMKDTTDRIVTNVGFDDEVILDLTMSVQEPCSFQVGFAAVNSQHVRIFTANCHPEPVRYEPGTYRFLCRLPKSLLVPDLYRLILDVHRSHRETLFYDEYALSWVVEETGSSFSNLPGANMGVINLSPEWEIFARN
jgi:lipopolysaccharide transport system ATP-binding protein